MIKSICFTEAHGLGLQETALLYCQPLPMGPLLVVGGMVAMGMAVWQSMERAVVAMEIQGKQAVKRVQFLYFFHVLSVLLWHCIS